MMHYGAAQHFGDIFDLNYGEKHKQHSCYCVCLPDIQQNNGFVTLAIRIHKQNIRFVTPAIRIIKQHGFITFAKRIITTQHWFYCVCDPDIQ